MIPAPPIADSQEVNTDDFLDYLKQPTDNEKTRFETPEPPVEETEETEDDSDLDFLEDEELIADLIVEGFDFAVSASCQAISGEVNEATFTVSDAKKKRIKDPLSKILKRYKVTMNPYFILFLLVIIIYAPVVNKAISIRKEKDNLKKPVEEREPKVEERRKPGRPRKEEATTKMAA